MYKPLFAINTPCNDTLVRMAFRRDHNYVQDLPHLPSVSLLRHDVEGTQIVEVVDENETEEEAAARIARTRERHALSVEQLETCFIALPNLIDHNEKPVTTTLEELDGHHAVRGIMPGTITEFVSEYKVDKTSLIYRILVNYLMEHQKSVAILITCTSVHPEDLLYRMLGAMNAEMPGRLRSLLICDIVEIEGLLTSIHLIRNTLRRDKVGLVIVDSVFVHLFRMSGDSGFRPRAITKFVHDLKELAVQHRIALAFANSFYVKTIKGKEERICCMGERYAQFVDSRVLLEMKDNDWVATLMRPKSEHFD